MSTRQYLNMAGVYAAPLFKRPSMDNQNMNNDDKFADIEDLLQGYLYLLEQRLSHDDHHGDLSLRKQELLDIRNKAMIFPKLRTVQIEYEERDVQNMISWLKDPV